MKQYLDLMQNILDNGIQQPNRTGVDTLMLPGAMLAFDLREGFPAVTTRKLPIKNIIGELVGFLKSTTSAKEFRELGCGFWNANANDNVAWLNNPNRKGLDDLGNIYGAVWNNWMASDTIIKVPCRVKQKPASVGYPIVNDLQPSIDGVLHTSTDGLLFTKLKRYPRDRLNNISGYYDVQFQATGSIIKARDSRVSKGNIKDPYSISCAGVGYIGELYKSDMTTKLMRSLYTTWYAMLSRCYDEKNDAYNYYGGSGVFVDSSWHSFSNFYKDVMLLPNWLDKKANMDSYQLDKDYYGSNCYSKDTCVWLTSSDNKLYANFEGAITVILPDGKEDTLFSIVDAAIKYDIPKGHINNCILGKRDSYKGFKFIRAPKPDGFNYRKPLTINQLHALIRTIKDDPTSRRLLVSAWRPDYLPTIALPSCHYGFQVILDTKNKLLHLLWSQRSCDFFLGIPANIASYAILAHLLARVTGYNVGTLTGFLADVHLYTNHLDQVKEQLKRNPKELPKVCISDRIGLDFPLDELMPSDIWLEGYTFEPAISAPMAV